MIQLAAALVAALVSGFLWELLIWQPRLDGTSRATTAVAAAAFCVTWALVEEWQNRRNN